MIEQMLSYKMLFFSTATTISYAFLPACYARKNLHGHPECGLSFTVLLPLLK